MGKRTSVYLSDGLAAAVDATGLPLAELVRRGIYGPPARPVVVPIRREVPQAPDTGVVQAGEVPPPDPAADVPAAVETPAETWVCGYCFHRQAIGSVQNCEQCGAGRPGSVPR